MDSLSRIVVAGDGTLLIKDDRLTDVVPFGDELSPDDPLRIAAHRMLTGTTATATGTATTEPATEDATEIDAGIRVRRVAAPDGTTAALEIAYAHATFTELPMESWRYPEPSETPGERPVESALGRNGVDARRPPTVTEYARSILLPGLPAFLSGITEMFDEGRALRDVRVVRHGSGEIRTVRLYGWLPEGAEIRPLGIAVDVTELSDAPDPSTRFFEAIISVVPDTVMVIEAPSGDIVWSNGQISEWLGYRRDQVSNYADFRALLHPRDRFTVDGLAARLRHDPASGSAEARFRMREAGGSYRWVHVWVAPWMSGPGGDVEQIVCTMRDVDEAVRAEQQMAWEAGHDPLTGLANRRVISETLQRAADDPTNDRRHVYFIDLDDFKKVNDAYGHSAGDDLLRTLAARISLVVRSADVVGRFGGDELIIVSALGPEQLGDRLLAAIRRPVMLGGTELTVTTSIGVARVAVAEDSGDVVRRANEAMYAAKRAGKNRYSIAGPLNTGPAQRRVEVESELRRAVSGSGAQMHMVFQPIVTADGTPVAAESLLRWQHPTRGTLLPSQFLDIAEAAGLMTELSELIVRQSMAAVTEWTAAGQRLMVTVNAGRRELGSGKLTGLIIAALDETGIAPQQVCLEVTESVLVDAGFPELAELWRLRELGLEIALDDFGTGYAPLTYLKRLPATILKLDKSFVSGLNLPVPNPVDLAVSRAVIELAHELGLTVIAEGVESELQMSTLASIGYEYFQGFWAHAPMRAGDLRELLAGGTSDLSGSWSGGKGR